MKTETANLSQIQVNTANPRTISNEKFEKLINSILVFPKMLDIRPIVVDDTFVALGGNMRYRALAAISDMDEAEIQEQLGGIRDFQKKTQAEQNNLIEHWLQWKDKPTAPVIKASELTDEEKREFIIKDNVGFGEWDMDVLANEWDAQDLDDWGVDVWQDTDGTGDSDTAGTAQTNSEPNNASLVDRFVCPPFSVLDTRQGYWQSRKRVWREFIGDMGESRNNKLIKSVEIKYKDLYQSTREHRKQLGISFKEYLDKYVPDDVKEREEKKVLSAGVSLFDPVLSEAMCKWFTPYTGARIFDCFAGDCQKGLVFAKCGYDFTGIELRQEQVDINSRIVSERDMEDCIRYICDDGVNVGNHFEKESQDLLFSCPPYYDLEVYSDLENDASNQGTYEEFIEIIRKAFTSAIECLKENRFAVIVVGDVRNKQTGFYYDFCGDIKRIFKDNGVSMFNEVILLETGTSTALRAGRYMEGRKVAKIHQNILVFYKGDTRNIRKEFKPIELSDDDAGLIAEIENAYAPKDIDGGQPEQSTGVATEDSPNNQQHDTDLDRLMKELVEFRKPYIKEQLISYQPYPRIKDALADGEIHIERDEDTGAIIGFLWLIDLKKKPISRIWEICSARKGLGRKLIERAINTRKHETLELYVVDYNENAKSFYEHMGFVEVERETGKKINNITMHYKGA